MTANNTLIRPATRQDALALAELASQLGYPSSQEQIKHRLKTILKDSDHMLFVAETTGRISGWVHIFIYTLVVSDRMAEIGGLVVDKHFRSQGIGKLLMQHAESWARDKKCTSAYLRSNVIRTQAHLFYEKSGYTRIKSQFAFEKKLV